MRGIVQDTGTGLLHVTRSDKFYTVETKDGVSWLTEYKGPGIAKARELNLAPLIASAPKPRV